MTHQRKYRPIFLSLLGMAAMWLLPGISGTTKLYAQESEVPTEIQLKFLTRILSYDRSIAEKINGEGKIVVGVIYQEKFWSSLSQKNEIALLAAKGLEVNGAKIVFKMIPVSEKMDLSTLPDKDEVSIYFITPLRGVLLSTIFQKSVEQKIMTFSAVPAYCTKGASVSIELKGNSPGIVINHAASVREGCNFSAQLLKVSRVIN